MVIKFSSFVLCLLSFYLIGNFFAKKYYVSFGINIKNLKASESVILGIFLFGSFTFVFNFFHKINSIFFYLIIFLFLLYIIFKTKKIKTETFQIKNILIFSLFTFILTLGLDAGYDAGYYHLPHQNIIREDKIVFGLSNFHHVLGKSSFYSYLSAPLWVKNNLINLPNIQIIFFSFLLLFFYEISKANKERSIFVLLILLSMPFWLKLAPIKWGLVDFPFGVVFFLSVVYSILIFSSKNKNEIKHFFIISLFLNCLTIFLKPSGFSIGLLTLFNIFYVLRKNIFSFKQIFIAGVFPGIILLLWFLKGFINTSCFIYPFPFTCIDTPWGSISDADSNLTTTKNWTIIVFDLIKNHFNFSATNVYVFCPILLFIIIYLHNLLTTIRFKISTNFFFIIISFIFFIELVLFNKQINFERENLTFIIILNQFIYFISLLIIFYLIIILSFSVKKINLKKFDFEAVPLLFSITILTLWIISAPIPRLAFSFFGAFFASFFFLIKKDNFLKINYNLARKLIRVFLITITLSYGFFSDYKFKELNFSGIYPPSVDIEPRYIFGVKPLNGQKCWDVTWCSPQDKKEVKMIELKSYKFFIK